MNVLDPNGEMEIHRTEGDPDHVAVRLPLAVRSQTWMSEFNQLAGRHELQADVRDLPHGTFLHVRVPAAASREEMSELLDGVLRLIDEARALANTRGSTSAATEQYIRDWWESRTQSTRDSAATD